jgi:hypothetical protein
MLLRIIRTRAKPGQWPDFEQDFLATSARDPDITGLHARWILHDLDDRDAGFVVALWEDESSALAFEQQAERHRFLTIALPVEFEFHLCEIRSVWNCPPDARQAARNDEQSKDR